jgi:hypothetical protein
VEEAAGSSRARLGSADVEVAELLAKGAVAVAEATLLKRCNCLGMV